MSFVEITTLMRLYSTIPFIAEKKIISEEIERNRYIYTIYQSLKLPHLVCNSDDIYCFFQNDIEPNFVTHNKICADVLVLNQKNVTKKDIQNKIVFIESADPGYDWIFSYNIKALVTMFGGANSHMTVRASELNIPAVIGCGAIKFSQWSKAHKIEIDCLKKQVVIIS